MSVPTKKPLAVALHYDNLLAKVVVHASDRVAAIRRMEHALLRTAVLGVRTNVEFLRRIGLRSDLTPGVLAKTRARATGGHEGLQRQGRGLS